MQLDVLISKLRGHEKVRECQTEKNHTFYGKK